MNRLRNRLIVAFLAATVIPLGATLWITTSLLERSLSFATTEELDKLSKSFQEIAREYYQESRQALREDALAGRTAAQVYSGSDTSSWPAVVSEFWESGDTERFNLAGANGNRLDYLQRGANDIRVYSRDLGDVQMNAVSEQYSRARQFVDQSKARDLRRGFTVTLLLAMAAVWLVSVIFLVWIAGRFSRPIQALTAGLAELASGNLDVQLREKAGNDEAGRAIQAFNHMAAQLKQSRERLVYLTQVASWQSLARKTAHELKNSLTPIRLTVEEIQARQQAADRQFMEQAVQIVVAEIETLERRVRAFSDFSSEPVAAPIRLDINALLQERISFLKPGHAGVRYMLRLSEAGPLAYADADQVKGILTNLLENAAEAAGPSGEVLATTQILDGKTCIEVHDSGPGLSAEASATLFEPTITFKKQGMGLGLSIARKSALMNGGDILRVRGELGGAAFRVLLPQD